MSAALELTGICVERGGRSLVRELSLDLDAGEVVAVVGPNGAGKSTLLRVASGEIAPTSGSARLSGRALQDWTASGRALRRAVVPQTSDLSVGFEVRDVVLLGRLPHRDRSNARDDEAAALRALARVGLTHLAQRTYTTLSGGERQRVHLARALAQLDGAERRGAVLLLDEPTASLDLAHACAALELIRGLADEGRAVLVVIHDLTLAARYADRAVVLRDGQALAQGAAREVLTPEVLGRAYDVELVRIDDPRLSFPVLLPVRARLGAAVAALALLCAPDAAHAEPELVVTGTRSPESTQRATVATRVVTRKEAERRGATDVGEALSGELGVQVNSSAYDYLGNPAAIQIQGFDADRVLVLEDGERVIGDVGGAIDLSRLPLAGVQRIEVVTGPTSSLYGASAIGGVVNVITAPPDAEGPSASARGEWRSRNTWLGLGTAALRADESWIALDGGYLRSDALRLRSPLPDTALPEVHRSSGGVRAGLPLFAGGSLLLKAKIVHDDLRGATSQVVPGLGRYTTETPETTRRYALYAGETLRLGASSLRISLARQGVDDATGDDRVASPLDETRSRAQALTSGEATVTWAQDAHCTWVFGARGEVERFSQSLRRTALVLGTLTQSEVVEVAPTSLGSAAAYAQLGWRPSRDVTVMPGARAEHHTRYGSVVAPRLAASVRASDAVTVRASLGRGFRAPSAKELGFFFDHSFLGYRVEGNPELRPETSWGVNGEVAWRVEPEVLVRVGGFANWVHDLIDFDLAPVQPGTGVTDYTYANIGKARTWGGEAQVRFALGSRLSSEVGYCFLGTRDDTLGRPLPSRRPHTVLAGLRWSLPAGFEIVGRWRAVSEAWVAEGVYAPPFTTVDVRVAKALGSNAQAYVGGTNLLDAARDPLRAGDQRPLAGRTLYLGLSAELAREP